MKLEVEFTREHSLGIFQLRGARVFEEAVRFWSELAGWARAEGLTAVLIRDEAELELPPQQIVEIVRAIESAALPRGLPVALVDCDLTAQGCNRFGELVAGNRGWPMIRVFTCEAEARRWLVRQQRAISASPATDAQGA